MINSSPYSLSFSVQRPLNLPTSCYISCESFFIEVCLDDNGYIISTKLILGQEPQVCIYTTVHVYVCTCTCIVCTCIVCTDNTCTYSICMYMNIIIIKIEFRNPYLIATEARLRYF